MREENINIDKFRKGKNEQEQSGVISWKWSDS